MTDLLKYLLDNVLGEKKYEIIESQESGRISYIIKTDPENIGLVIGKEGRMIKSLRNILKVRATLEKSAVTLNVEG